LEKLHEILKREPGLFELTKEFLESAEKPDIDFIAVTSGPGLEPALMGWN
jgi:tRNA A37 threonylcarbamoyltransferase TsaD